MHTFSSCRLTVAAVAALSLLLGCAPSGGDAEASLERSEALETDDGWRVLFGGSSFAGWRGVGRDSVPTAHWVVEDGTIRKIASGSVATAADGQPLEGGDIMTTDTFEHFELSFEWKVAPGANSGIKYNVSEVMSTSAPPKHAALGFEYQVLDDDCIPMPPTVPTGRRLLCTT